MKELHLNIAEHQTPILIGRDLVTGLSSLNKRKVILLVDENVLRLHAEKFNPYICISVPSGEKHKTISFVESLYRQLVEAEVDRSSLIVGIGGGLATDVAGFAASTYMRGLDFGFISSTLLGQVDASIGGKNGVNLDGYKNMIGTFNQPAFVWCDLSLLSTLDQKEIVSGLAEVVKYGAIRDADLLSFVEKKKDEILALDEASMQQIVESSVKIKVDIVESDVHENGDRKLLNFGHTLGHAIEKLTGMLHGEAISIGMVLAARISVKLEFLGLAEADRLEKVLSDLGLPVSTNLSKEELFSTLLKDKKRAGKNMHLVLLRDLGDAFIHEINLDSLKNILYDLY